MQVWSKRAWAIVSPSLERLLRAWRGIPLTLRRSAGVAAAAVFIALVIGLWVLWTPGSFGPVNVREAPTESAHLSVESNLPFDPSLVWQRDALKAQGEGDDVPAAKTLDNGIRRMSAEERANEIYESIRKLERSGDYRHEDLIGRYETLMASFPDTVSASSFPDSFAFSISTFSTAPRLMSHKVHQRSPFLAQIKTLSCLVCLRRQCDRSSRGCSRCLAEIAHAVPATNCTGAFPSSVDVYRDLRSGRAA